MVTAANGVKDYIYALGTKRYRYVVKEFRPMFSLFMFTRKVSLDADRQQHNLIFSKF